MDIKSLKKSSLPAVVVVADGSVVVVAEGSAVVVVTDGSAVVVVADESVVVVTKGSTILVKFDYVRFFIHSPYGTLRYIQ